MHRWSDGMIDKTEDKKEKRGLKSQKICSSTEKILVCWWGLGDIASRYQSRHAQEDKSHGNQAQGSYKQQHSLVHSKSHLFDTFLVNSCQGLIHSLLGHVITGFNTLNNLLFTEVKKINLSACSSKSAGEKFFIQVQNSME